MDVYDYNEFIRNKDKLLKEIRNGAIFIYPTDTIYGIGCDATNEMIVKKLRKIKNSKNPFSIIVPSLEWIEKNCVLGEKARVWIKKLPGAYTLILPLKNKDCIARSVNFFSSLVGVRIPAHWITSIVTELNLPIVTTSANKTGEPYMTSLDDLDDYIKEDVDFVINEGKKEGRPSTIVHLHDEFKIIKR